MCVVGGREAGKISRFFTLSAGASDSPRTLNAHIWGHGASNHHQNSTKGPPREGEKNENCGGRREKRERNIWRSGRERAVEVKGGGPGSTPTQIHEN